MNENRRDDTALSPLPTPSARPAESGSGASAGGTHTPGPWKIVPNFGGSRYPSIVNPAGDAELGDWMVAERVRWPTDAALIAAAPTMAKAIEAMLMRLRVSDYCATAEYNGLWSALAEAYGRDEIEMRRDARRDAESRSAQPNPPASAEASAPDDDAKPPHAGRT